MDVQILKATTKDIPVLLELGRKTFKETYGKDNSTRDMDLYLRENFTLTRIAKEMNSRLASFFIIYENGIAVSYTKIRIHRKWNQKCMEIETLYVLESEIGKGYGKELMSHSLEIAHEKKVRTVWAQVWGAKINSGLKAIEFYKQWGFMPFGKAVFRLGNSLQDDILMKKEL